MTKTNIGEFIAALRKSSGYTQQEVADRLGVSNKTVSSWETGASCPDISMLPALAELYGVTCDEILRGELLLGLMLLDGDTPAGFALLAKSYSREAGGICLWVDEVYLRPAFRGKGLGKELLSYAETLGAKRLRLEVVPDNERAIGLYRSFGYTPMQYWQMVKEL